MADIVRRDTTAAVTTNLTQYDSASFTPVAGDLLVFCVRVTGTVGSGPRASSVSGTNGITFGATGVGEPLINQFSNASAHKDIIFIANQLVPASPAAMSLRVVLTSGDTASGCIMGVFAVTGMSRVGLDAVRQFIATDNNIPTGAAPASVTLPSAPLTTNPLLMFHGNITSGGMTPPTSWTELLDQTFATPTTGAEVAKRASGQTSATVTTGSNSTVGAMAVIEFDASVPSLEFEGWGSPL